MLLIDSHCHLDFPQFDPVLQQVLEQAVNLGVRRFVLAGVSQETWPRLWQCTTQYESCFASLGLHPYFLTQHQPQHLHNLEQWLDKHRQQSKLCAIGEIGLDYQLQNQQRDIQQYYFEQQLKLAQQFDLPVIVHVRKAHAQCIATLKRITPQRGGIIHAFNGSLEQAAEYQKLGFLLGIGGAYSWPNARKLRALLPRLPLAQLALETDSPHMAPAFIHGQRNSPQHLPQLCRLLAEDILQIPATELARQTTANLCQLLGWDIAKL